VRFSSLNVKQVVQHLKARVNNRRVGVFLIFLAISAMFWFLTQLEDDYVTRISYPVEYQDMPADKIVVGNLPAHLDLEVKGQGFKLLEYQFSNELNPLILHLNAYNLQSQDQGDSPKYYIVTQSAFTQITQQLSQEVEILNIAPDTLFFEFAEKARKRVPVRPDIDYNFDNQMMLKGKVRLEPDSVNISGPNSVLDTIEVVYTQKRTFDHLKQTVQTNLGLAKAHPQVEYDHNRVKLTIPVEQYTEGEVEKEIVAEHLPDSLILRTFPRSVSITYLVGLSKYERVIPELFKATVDYRQVQQGREHLRVEIKQAPDYLKSYSFAPEEVEYIIEKKP